MDARFSKLHLVNDNFFFLSDRVDVSEDTRINADKTVVEEYAAMVSKTSEDGQPLNFVSEIFFLALAYHHYGVLSTIRYDGNLAKQLKKMKEQVDKLREDEQRGAWEGPMKMAYMNQFKNFQVRILLFWSNID